MRIFSIFQLSHESKRTPAASPAKYPGLESVLSEPLESDSLLIDVRGVPMVTPTYGFVVESAKAGGAAITSIMSNGQSILLLNMETSMPLFFNPYTAPT